MSDREMLLLAYGALKSLKTVNPEVLKIIEGHLFKKESIK